MEIGVLTSSRADFGIYYPLVKELTSDDFFNVEIIAFGTHLKEQYGFTIKEITNLGFDVNHKIETSVNNEKASDIAQNVGDTIQKFSKFWDTQRFDLVIALGDRYEMFGAVAAASPFNIDIAHIHAGETTLGAIDNAYRHSISLFSKYLFVTTEEYKRRASEIISCNKNIFNVGALSIDNLMRTELMSVDEFKEHFNIDISKPYILSTFHPETISFEKNKEYILELISAFEEIREETDIIITMPNSDTMGNMIRRIISEFAQKYRNIHLVESFGMKGYLTCMEHTDILIGNTSSGFVEAAFFPKKVINLGDRQKGRILTDNIYNCEIVKEKILKSYNIAKNAEIPQNVNIYGDGNAAKNIVSIIKSLYEHR